MKSIAIAVGIGLLVTQGAYALEVDRDSCPEKILEHCYEEEMGVLPPDSFNKAVNGTLSESDKGATAFFDEVEDCCQEIVDEIIKKRQEKRRRRDR